MDIAKITAKGQITIPIEIRRKLRLKEGDKIIFFEDNDGRVYFENAALVAITHAQEALAGAAEEAGIASEDDVNTLVKDLRRELWEQRYESNA